MIQSTAALKDRSGQQPASAGGGSGGSAGSGSGSGNAASCSFLGNSGSNNMGLGSGSAGGNGYYNMMSSSSSGSGSGNSTTCVDGSNSINRSLSGHIGGAPASSPTMVPSEFAAMIPGGLHIKDAKQINNEAGKNGRDIVSIFTSNFKEACALTFSFSRFQPTMNHPIWLRIFFCMQCKVIPSQYHRKEVSRFRFVASKCCSFMFYFT